MRTLPIAIAAVALLAGCASDTMRSYVGRPLSETVMDYGAPAAATDLDQNTRAFTWVMDSSYTTAGSLTTVGTAGASMWTASSYYQPAQTIGTRCGYTLYAKRLTNGIAGPAGWIVTGFRPPSTWCE